MVRKTDDELSAERKKHRELAQFQGGIDKYNNLNPDQLHLDWMKAKGLVAVSDGTLMTEREAELMGEEIVIGPEYELPKYACGICGDWGHNARACPNRVKRGRPKGSQGRCSKCLELGHTARSCIKVSA